MRIAVDAMGGDFAPKEIVRGAVDAAKKYDCEIVLIGNEEKIRTELQGEDFEALRISIVHAAEVIGMNEHPAEATGAAVAAAQLILHRIRGVGRPAIATPMPTPDGVTLMLDSGANVDSKPEHLVQSAVMGSLYAQYVFGVEHPRVGLLNIGEEETKGNEQAKETYQLLKAEPNIHFTGNAEGRDVPKGNFDVVVCDGFVGNVVLKFAEGLAKTILGLIQEEIHGAGIMAKLGALLLMPTLRRLGKRLDVREYGGAPLLGVNGCCVIGHGSSDARSIASAIGVTVDYVNGKVLDQIRDALAKEGDSNHAQD